MKTYCNNHLTITTECGIHLICQTWTGVPTSECYREGCLMALQLSKEHHLKRWLIDQRQLDMFRPKDIQWFIETWIPQANRHPSRTIQVAIVLADTNQFNKLGSDLVLRAALAANDYLQSRYFTDKPAARQWLTTSRDQEIRPHKSGHQSTF